LRLLKWFKIDDKDISSSEGDFVFRLHRTSYQIKTKYMSEKIKLDIFQLQIRKKQNIEFKNLGYKFLLSNTQFINESNFVDNKVWTDIGDISERAEEILIGLHFIDES
jgi:hypothetical protein